MHCIVLPKWTFFRVVAHCAHGMYIPIKILHDLMTVGIEFGLRFNVALE